MSDFVSFPLFAFTLVIKLKKIDFKSHWNAGNFFLIKKIMPDLDMSCQTLSDFAEAVLCEYDFANKLRNADFKLY